MYYVSGSIPMSGAPLVMSYINRLMTPIQASCNADSLVKEIIRRMRGMEEKREGKKGGMNGNGEIENVTGMGWNRLKEVSSIT